MPLKPTYILLKRLILIVVTAIIAAKANLYHICYYTIALIPLRGKIYIGPLEAYHLRYILSFV